MRHIIKELNLKKEFRAKKNFEQENKIFFFSKGQLDKTNHIIIENFVPNEDQFCFNKSMNFLHSGIHL